MLKGDQAAGLRQIFSQAPMPVSITFAGAGGRSAIVAEVARGLAVLGKEVLVIDENAAPDNVAAAFGIAARYDLMQAVNCDVPPNQVVLRAEPAIRIIPAARAARESTRLDAAQRRAVAEWLRRLQKGVDYVLVDSAGYAKGVSLLQPPPHRVVVVAAATSLGITDAYAQIKRLARESDCRVFEVIVAQAASCDAGETVFANMRDVARRHLAVRLELTACVSTPFELGAVGLELAESLLHPAYALSAETQVQATQRAQFPQTQHEQGYGQGQGQGRARTTTFLNFGHGMRSTPVADPVV